MKTNFCLLFSLFLCLFVGTTIPSVSAQEMSKAEERALKKELRDLKRDLNRYQRMKMEDQALDAQISNKEGFLSTQGLVLDELNRQLTDRDQEIAMLEQEKIQHGTRLTTSSVDGKEQRVFFRVQIGAYQNKRIAEALSQNVNFSVEQGDGGLTKYMIGQFNSYQEAKQLAESLIDQGAQAFVVGYIDNSRVSNLKQMPKEYF